MHGQGCQVQHFSPENQLVPQAVRIALDHVTKSGLSPWSRRPLLGRVCMKSWFWLHFSLISTPWTGLGSLDLSLCSTSNMATSIEDFYFSPCHYSFFNWHIGQVAKSSSWRLHEPGFCPKLWIHYELRIISVLIFHFQLTWAVTYQPI